MIELHFPSAIKTNLEGYLFLTELYRQAKDLESQDIILDFSDTSWFDANMLALLGAIVDKLRTVNSFEFRNMKSKHLILFRKNHFLCEFGQGPLNDTYNSTVKYKKFDISDIMSLEDYLETDLLSKSDFPKTSKLLRKKIKESSIEIFDNAVYHSHCKNVFTCGQYYRGMSDMRLDFTIVDIGRTIRRNVRDYYEDQTIRGNEAIEWAVARGNTTKTGNIPGGLGFSLIREFLQKNKGKIQIFSADGFWEEKGKHITSKEIDGFFQGTVVNLEFNLNDRSYYYFGSEIPESEIPF
jgi:hypothetical protein